MTLLSPQVSTVTQTPPLVKMNLGLALLSSNSNSKNVPASMLIPPYSLIHLILIYILEFRITLSGLLNALDGVSAQEGRLLFATTNKYDSLDPALTRPGRMDLHIEFKLASKFQARELYRCFYLPDSDSPTEVAAQSNQKELTEKEPPLIEVDETASNASGESTAVPSTLPSPTLKLLSLPDTPSDSTIASTSTSITVSNRPPRRKERAPRLTRSEVDKLATMFSDLLPEREFSMAALQGYLMMYKTRPAEAVHDFTAWVEKERKEKKDREAKKAREATKAKEAKKEEEARKEQERVKEAEKSNEKKDDTKDIVEGVKTGAAEPTKATSST